MENGTPTFFHACRGRPEDAVAVYRKGLTLSPKNDVLQAMIALGRVSQPDPREELAQMASVEDPFWRLLAPAMIHHLAHRKAESDAALAEFTDKYQAGARTTSHRYTPDAASQTKRSCR